MGPSEAGEKEGETAQIGSGTKKGPLRRLRLG
jgi:hypothetical protein